MNEFDLRQKLLAARVPERPWDYWEEFPAEVLKKLRPTSVKNKALGIGRPWLAWGFGLAFTCVMIGLAFGLWRERKPSDTFALFQNEKTVREILAMFPNRIRAIEQDEHDVRLVLSDNADVPDSTPL